MSNHCEVRLELTDWPAKNGSKTVSQNPASLADERSHCTRVKETGVIMFVEPGLLLMLAGERPRVSPRHHGQGSPFVLLPQCHVGVAASTIGEEKGTEGSRTGKEASTKLSLFARDPSST